MVWKYPRAQKIKAEEQIQESQTAANIGKVENWKYYPQKSQEYKEGLRISI